jgi:arylsulfatase
MINRPTLVRRGALAVPILVVGACGAAAPVPDVALVVIDTLRADALSCYGNPRPTTPGLDRLAREGLLFEELLAHAPNTAPSHASLFTGLHPWAHATSNARHPEFGPGALDDRFVTLAERFAAAGYQTAAITDGLVLGPRWNLLQGFEHVQHDTAGVRAKVDQALALLEEGRDGRPLFLFLHTYQVHMPYTAPEPYARRFDPDYVGVLSATDAAIRESWNEHGEPPSLSLVRDQASFTPRDMEHLVALYHGELLYTDHELQRLWPLLTDALVVVTSDHGEEFGEHGQIGHRQLHRETLHVPLLVRLPGGAGGGRRVSGRVGTIDIHALLLREAGLAPPAGAIDLLALRPGGEGVHHAARTDRLTLGPQVPMDRAVRLGDLALLERSEGDTVMRWVYDMEHDPGALAPLLESAPELEQALERHAAEQDALRAAILGPQGRAVAAPLDDETRRQLRALGYGSGD